MKRFIQIVADLLLSIFLVFVALTVVVVVASKRDIDGTAEIFGYQLRVVTSDSMGECELTDVSQYEIKSIPIESLIVVQTIPDDPNEAQEWYRNLKVGDVLTFRYVYGTQITITHRVAAIVEKEGGYIIDLAGDNKNAKDNQLYQTIDTTIPNNPNYVVGKVVWTASWAGKLLNALKTPIGLIFLIWIPCVIIVIMQVYEIGTATSNRKQRRETKKLSPDYYCIAQEDPAPTGALYDTKLSNREWRKQARAYRKQQKASTFFIPKPKQGKNANKRLWKKRVKAFRQQVSDQSVDLPEMKQSRAKDRAWRKYNKQYNHQDSSSFIALPKMKRGGAGSDRSWRKQEREYRRINKR
jgi:signal peptidase I